MIGREAKKESDLHLDAWERFERAVDVVANPRHSIEPKNQKRTLNTKLVLRGRLTFLTALSRV
jgi:hypothetical protein